MGNSTNDTVCKCNDAAGYSPVDETKQCGQTVKRHCRLNPTTAIGLCSLCFSFTILTFLPCDVCSVKRSIPGFHRS